jgi:hypothetical protein
MALERGGTMNAGTLKGGRGLSGADGGGTWRTVWLRDDLAGPPRLHPSFLVTPEREPDDRGLGGPWFPDYDEVE